MKHILALWDKTHSLKQKHKNLLYLVNLIWIYCTFMLCSLLTECCGTLCVLGQNNWIYGHKLWAILKLGMSCCNLYRNWLRHPSSKKNLVQRQKLSFVEHFTWGRAAKNVFSKTFKTRKFIIDFGGNILKERDNFLLYLFCLVAVPSSGQWQSCFFRYKIL